MELAIGSDHAAYNEKDALKKYLQGLGHTVTDVGTDSEAAADYPDFARRVAERVAAGLCERGILLCHTGIGMSMAANKVAGIRAALVHDEYTAKMSRLHNDANILCFGAASNSVEEMKKLAELWFNTAFDGGERHARRVAKIDRAGEPERD